MKKIYLSLVLTVLTLFLGFKAVAQPVFTILGNNTGSNPSTSYPSPFGNWFWGSHHQMFVTAGELTTAGVGPGANILSIGLNIVATNGAAAHQNWVVTVYTTTATNPINGAFVTTGQVSTSTLTTVNGVIGWYQTPIAPFVWNGTDNLIIETCTYNGSYTYNYSTAWTNNLTGGSTKTYLTFEDNVTSCGQVDLSTQNSTTTRPDLRFEWEYLTPCSGTPGNNSVVTPTFQVCPNVPYGAIGLGTSYTVSGLQYTWMQSTTSNVGPFTPVPSNGAGWTYSVPGLTTTTWYQAVITCTNSNQSYTTAGAAVQVAATVTDNVPYGESFENIGQPDRLPNCSWWAANQGTTVKTYTSSQSNNRIARTGSSFLVFGLPSTNNSVYTNGIYMEPGITYSAGGYFSTEYFGYSNWQNLTVSYGPNQSSTGATVIATEAPALSGPYKLISGTFQVPSAGIYYLRFNANGSTGSANYLMLDDVFVNIPCTASSGNTPTVSLSASTQTICAGDAVSLNATGADTYMWSTGATGSSISDSPSNTIMYTVTGTNTLTGCTHMQNVSVVVNPAPTVNAFASSPEICPGQTTYLSAVGASAFAWSNSSTGSVINVSPNTTTSYSVIGTNQFGCTGTGVITITVKTPPTINANSSNANACIGEQINLNAVGGVSYTWYSSNSSMVLGGNPALVVITAPTTFTVLGTGANGCTAKATVIQGAETCNNISENTGALTGVSVYPNPTSGLFTVELKSGAIKSVVVTDVTGRTVLNSTVNGNSSEVNLDGFSSGVYYVKISSENSFSVVRVVKN